MKKVEAEGGELILRSGNGSYAVIPKYLGGRVRSLLEQEDYEGIDQIVNTLPLEEDYAEDGTLMLPTKKKNPTDPPAGSQGLNAPPMFQPSDKTKWFSTSAGLSKYKGLVDAELNDESEDFILGYYANEDYGPYKKGTHEEYTKTSKILPIRKGDLPGLKERGLELPVDYEALLEGTGQSQSQNVASTNQFKTGGYVKAADGLVVNPDGDPPSGVKKDKSPKKGIYTNESYTQLQKEYVGNKFVKYGQAKPNGGKYECLGTCRENFTRAYPEYSSYLTELEGAGMYSKYPGGIYTKSKNKSKDGAGPDSWDIPYLMEELGVGKILVMSDMDDPQRIDKLSKVNYLDIPIGSILSYGSAKGEYVDKDALSYRGKKEALPRHSTIVMGFVEGVDYDNNPTTDIIIDNLGNLERYGNSSSATETWDQYLNKAATSNPIIGITARNSMTGNTYKGLGGKHFPTPESIDRNKKKQKEEAIDMRFFDLDKGIVPENELTHEDILYISAKNAGSPGRDKNYGKFISSKRKK